MSNGALNINRRRQTQIFDKTADYTLVENDYRNVIVFNSPVDVTCTVPLGLRLGFNCTIIQKGAGKVFVDAETGSTVNDVITTGPTAGQWHVARVVCIADNEYTVEFSTAGNGSILNNAVQLSRIIEGNASWSGTGLQYDVVFERYYIEGIYYEALATSVTGDPAHPAFPRIDVIYLDNTGNVGIIIGDPGPNPIKPSVDPLTQIELTHYDVAAGALVPTNATQEDIYDENVEWTGTSNNPTTDFEYAVNPHTGTYSARIQATAGHGFYNYLSWKKPTGTANTADWQNLRFWIKQGAITTPGALVTKVELYEGVNYVGSFGIYDGTYGFNCNSLDWQLIIVPINAMGITSATFSEFLFYNSSGVPLQFDTVALEGTGGHSGCTCTYILNSQLGNPFQISIFEDVDGSGRIELTKL